MIETQVAATSVQHTFQLSQIDTTAPQTEVPDLVCLMNNS